MATFSSRSSSDDDTEGGALLPNPNRPRRPAATFPQTELHRDTDLVPEPEGGATLSKSGCHIRPAVPDDAKGIVDVLLDATWDSPPATMYRYKRTSKGSTEAFAIFKEQKRLKWILDIEDAIECPEHNLILVAIEGLEIVGFTMALRTNFDITKEYGSNQETLGQILKALPYPSSFRHLDAVKFRSRYLLPPRVQPIERFDEAQRKDESYPQAFHEWEIGLWATNWGVLDTVSRIDEEVRVKHHKLSPFWCVLELAVMRDRQNRGIGQALVEAMRLRAEETETPVFAIADQEISAYQKCKFEKLQDVEYGVKGLGPGSLYFHGCGVRSGLPDPAPTGMMSSPGDLRKAAT